jgi:hypothetical protein
VIPSRQIHWCFVTQQQQANTRFSTVACLLEVSMASAVTACGKRHTMFESQLGLSSHEKYIENAWCVFVNME